MFVYVIGPERGAQKIGIAKDPAARMRDLQCGHPTPLILSATLAVPPAMARQVEMFAHRALDACRLAGEWFDIPPTDAKAVIEQATAAVFSGEKPVSLGMQPARLSEILVLLRMTERGLGHHVGYTVGAVQNWVAGRARVPADIAAWLERRATEWRSDPPPQRTK